MTSAIRSESVWVQWGLTGLVGLAGIAAAVYYFRGIDAGQRTGAASKSTRRQTYQSLLEEGAKLSDFDTPQFLLNTAIDLYERKHSAMAVLDDKAQKLVALIGGGASLFALLGGFTGSLHASLTPLLVLAMACFFVGLLLLLFALRPVETDIPTITEFNSVPILADPAFRAKIARRMIEAWQDITLGLTPILRRKGRFVFVSMLLIVAGSSLLLVNFMLLIQTLTSDPSSTITTARISCEGGIKKSHNNKINLSCEGRIR